MNSELTPRAVILGVLLSVVMGAANVYIGLKAGMTVSASIPAAVMAMLLFRALFGRSQVLEANQVQTAASAGESLAAGIIFTMPALVMVGFWRSFDFVTVWLVALSGGLLGVLLMIPMRRVFVVENSDLPYPEGVACAAVLQAGAEHSGTPATGEARALLTGGLLGAGFKLCSSHLGVLKGALEGAFQSGGRAFYFGSEISPMLVSVGAIVGLNVAILIFIGGAVAWLVGLPLFVTDLPIANPLEHAWSIWSTKIRYIGVGAMVVGGVVSIIQVRRGLLHAIESVLGKHKLEAGETNRDLPRSVILPLGVLLTVIVAGLYWHFTSSVMVTVVALIAMLLMAFFFSAVASYIVGLVGNSNSPVSGMTITTVLFTGGLLYILGVRDMQAMVATLGVAAVVCCAACTSGDVCNDLKTGSLVGATPARQQLMQILGVVVASLIMAPVLQLLHETADGGIGGKELPAPQAGLFASLAKALSGQGELPLDLLAIGAGLGLVTVAIDSVLKARGAAFRAHLMPIAVGMYLPFMLAPPILVGGLIAYLAKRQAADESEAQRRHHRLTLFASGVIAGESLIGIGLALLTALDVKKPNWPLSEGLLTGATLVAAVGIVWSFVHSSRGANGPTRG
jgi:putative OPT family oligopeptide transporter